MRAMIPNSIRNLHLRKRIALLLVFVLVVSSVFSYLPAVAGTRTIIVPDDFSTISAAIDYAAESDTVYIKSGRYEINETLTINKSISITGEDAATTLLVGPGVNPWMFSLEVAIAAIEVNADNFKISQVTFTNCDIGISVSGEGTEVSNTVMPMVSISGSHSVISNNNITDLFSVAGSYQTITGNNLTAGLDINGSFSSITYNKIGYDIYLQGSHNTIRENTFSTMFLEYADSNIISNNSFTCLWVGYMGHACWNNTVFGNIAKGPSIWGMLMGAGSNNIFHDNYIAGYIAVNDGYGIAIGGSNLVAENNVFYYNTLVNNTKGVGYNWELEGSGNVWDNGKEGNYWSDYNGTDANGDGIGDTPYIIDGKNIDRYPLMSPLTVFSSSSSTPSTEPQNEPEPEQFPIALFLVLSATVLTVVILLFYFNKRRHGGAHL